MTEQISNSLNSLKEKVSKQSLIPAQKAFNDLRALLEKMKGQIAIALPKHCNPERFARVALTLVRTNPKLLECSQESILGGLMSAAQLGLELGILGQGYLVPYKSNKTGRLEAQFIIGYKGMISIARRSGEISTLKAEPVFQNDLFKLEYGLEDRLQHIPWHSREDKEMKEPGNFKGAYAIAKFKDGGHAILYMPKFEIDEHRQRSKTPTQGPWVTDYTAMALKTVIRGIWKWLPISIEQASAVEATDESVKKEIKEEMDSVIDAEIQTDFFPEDENKDLDKQESQKPNLEIEKSPPPKKPKKFGAILNEIMEFQPSIIDGVKKNLGFEEPIEELDEGSLIVIMTELKKGKKNENTRTEKREF